MSTEASPDDQSRLLSRFGRRFAAGEVIFAAGSPANEAYLLQEGRVRLILRVGNAERSLRVLRPGDLFGEQALVPGTPRTSTAVALVDSTALALETGTFEHILTGNPAVGMRVLQQLIRRLRDAEDQIEILMLRDSQVKVCVALLQLAQEAHRNRSENGESVTLSVSPMDLSARVGLDVDTVKRNIQQLRTSGHVRIEGEQIQIPDLEGMYELRRLLELKDEIAGGVDPAKASPRREQT
ncbi:MAG TPA: Crp/Fnr family transcriptional regulator [Polyangiaceae bacterium]|nr:Crp/Fnr family transcriptional regulator [Polyangiaceae bacterium]